MYIHRVLARKAKVKCVFGKLEKQYYLSAARKIGQEKWGEAGGGGVTAYCRKFVPHNMKTMNDC